MEKKLNKESARKLFEDNGLSAYECDITLMHVLGVNKIQLFLYDKNFHKVQIKMINKVLKQRKKGKPLDLIFLQSSFFGYNFYVNKHVLKPRGDSEVLVDQVVKSTKSDVRILDLCCGCGCIGLSIAKELKRNNFKTELVLSDVSKKALKVATKNAKKLNVDCNIVQSDLFDNLDSGFDVIVCNPPYIKTDVIKTLDKEVKNYDPKIALDGGKDGLVFYKNICANADRFLAKDGLIFLEIGFGQKEEIQKVFKDWQINFTKDFSGIDRVATIKRKKRKITDINPIATIVSNVRDDVEITIFDDDDAECNNDVEATFSQYFTRRK